MNPYVLLGLAAAWALSLGVTSYKSYGAGQDSIIAADSKAERLVLEATKAAQLGAAQAISKLIPVNKTIVQRIENEVRTHTVYADCKHTPDGLRVINEAITGRGAKPTGDSKLPGPDAPGK